LPHEWYDEWYVFQTPPELGKLWSGNIFEAPQSGYVATFVNFGCFNLFDPEMQDLIDLFWARLEQVRPESFIADGDFLNFVTCDSVLFTAVYAAFKVNVKRE